MSQNGKLRDTIHMKMCFVDSFIFMQIKFIFLRKVFPRKFVLKQRHKVIDVFSQRVYILVASQFRSQEYSFERLRLCNLRLATDRMGACTNKTIVAFNTSLSNRKLLVQVGTFCNRPFGVRAQVIRTTWLLLTNKQLSQLCNSRLATDCMGACTNRTIATSQCFIIES